MPVLLPDPDPDPDPHYHPDNLCTELTKGSLQCVWDTVLPQLVLNRDTRGSMKLVRGVSMSVRGIKVQGGGLKCGALGLGAPQ